MLQLLALSLLSPAAHAATVKPIGTVELQGTVEVPLYAGLDSQDRAAYVEAQVGENKLLLRVASGHYELRLTEAALGKIGVKASGKEGAKKAKIGELDLGTMKVKNAAVTVVDPSGAEDGEIGLPGLQVGWAVLPSKGVARFATGPDAATLVTSVGTAMPLMSASKSEKKQVGSEKVEIDAAATGAMVKWSGAEIATTFKLEEASSWLAREVEGVDWYTLKGGKSPVKLPEAPGYAAGVVRTEWREVTIGATTAWTAVDRVGQGEKWAIANVFNASLGGSVLAAMDLAADPTSHTVALAPAAAVKHADYSATYEAGLRKALEPAPVKDGATPPTAEEAAKARAGAAGPLADYLEGRGKFDEAISLRKEITAANPDDCTSYLSLGSTLVAAARPAEAVEPLTKAAALYLPWSQLSLGERTEIGEKKAAAEKKKETWTGQIPQANACHVASGLLAVAQLQSKNLGAVAELYPARLDLDPTLAIAAGNAAILEGKFDVAQAAYRQALKISGGTNEDARIGLYLAMAPKSFANAREQLEVIDLAAAGTTDPLLVRLYLEGVRSAQGADGVKKALDAMLAERPWDALLLAWRSHERAAAGDAAGATQDADQAKARFAAQLAVTPNDPKLLAAWGSALAVLGDAAKAKEAADQAVQLAPGQGSAWIASADAATAAGDTAKAADSRKKAGMAWASNPAYALLLQ